MFVGDWGDFEMSDVRCQIFSSEIPNPIAFFRNWIEGRWVEIQIKRFGTERHFEL